ncbi:hypothetical protein EV356DRAFT_39781 [Viridothelium virens]|uniref:Uncharacterized protein n=1 Tax=Viridothelium virens TaxID=1048519 RepID=A0A6A6HFR5_VIRVR|nr:hypothetical protein EV356DRAFT_39781 [Viridothelium virens]
MSERPQSSQLNEYEFLLSSHVSIDDGQGTPRPRVRDATRTLLTSNIPESQSTQRPLARAESSYFTNPQLQGLVNQEDSPRLGWQDGRVRATDPNSEIHQRADSSSVDLGNSLRRAYDLTPESDVYQLQMLPQSQKSSEDLEGTLKGSDSSDDSSRATSTSGSFTRLSHRGKPDRRMFDKSGAPLESIRLEQKKGPKPYSYQEMMQKAEMEAKQNAVVSPPTSEQSTQDEGRPFPTYKQDTKQGQGQVSRSLQEPTRHRDTASQPPSPMPRPAYSRAASGQSAGTVSSERSVPKDARDSKARKSMPDTSTKGSKRSSLATVGIKETQHSEPPKSASRSSLRKSKTSSPSEISNLDSRISQEMPGPSVSPLPPAEIQAPKAKHSFARLFSKSLATQLEEASLKEGHQVGPSLSPKPSILGGLLKLRPGRRSNRSSEASQEIPKDADVSTNKNLVLGGLSTGQALDSHGAKRPSEPLSIHPSEHASPGKPKDKAKIPASSPPYSHLSFLATEAQKVTTPPPVDNFKVQQYYFDFFGTPKALNVLNETETPLENDDSPIFEHPVRIRAGDVDRLSRRKASPMAMPIMPVSHDNVEGETQRQDIKAKGAGVHEHERKPSRFEIDIPDHLSSSPLCPLNQKRNNGTRLICPMHGRKKSPGRTADTSQFM